MLFFLVFFLKFLVRRVQSVVIGVGNREGRLQELQIDVLHIQTWWWWW